MPWRYGLLCCTLVLLSGCRQLAEYDPALDLQPLTRQPDHSLADLHRQSSLDMAHSHDVSGDVGIQLNSAFSCDFDSCGIEQFSCGGGQVLEGVLMMTGYNCEVKGHLWSDNFEISAKMRFDKAKGSNSQLGLFARYHRADPPGAYSPFGSVRCILSTAYTGLFAAVVDGNVKTSYLYKKTALPHKPKTGTWYQMRLRVVGDTYTCTASEGSLSRPYSATYARKFMATGTVGFTLIDADASFDDLHVVMLPD